MDGRSKKRLARLPLLDSLLEGQGRSNDSASERIRRLKESVRRDLQDLLNTRQRCLGWSEDLQELETSVLDYGIPDLTGTNLSSQERRSAFLSELEVLIRRHDQRFQSISIQSMDNSDPFDRTLRFRIEGTLLAETGKESAAFDFRLEPITRHFE